jgi:hypothetical protein
VSESNLNAVSFGVVARPGGSTVVGCDDVINTEFAITHQHITPEDYGDDVINIGRTVVLKGCRLERTLLGGSLNNITKNN